MCRIGWPIRSCRPGLPEPFDYSLLITFGTKKIQGRDVPFIHFRDRQNTGGFAEVLILQKGQFDLENVRDAQASHTRAVVYPKRYPGIVFVILHTGPDLAPFLKPSWRHGLMSTNETLMLRQECMHCSGWLLPHAS